MWDWHSIKTTRIGRLHWRRLASPHLALTALRRVVGDVNSCLLSGDPCRCEYPFNSLRRPQIASAVSPVGRHIVERCVVAAFEHLLGALAPSLSSEYTSSQSTREYSYLRSSRKFRQSWILTRGKRIQLRNWRFEDSLSLILSPSRLLFLSDVKNDNKYRVTVADTWRQLRRSVKLETHALQSSDIDKCVHIDPLQ